MEDLKHRSRAGRRTIASLHWAALSVAESALVLGVRDDTIRREVDCGNLKAEQRAKFARLRIQRADFIAYLLARWQEATR